MVASGIHLRVAKVGQNKWLEKLERTATVEIQISSEDVILATKEPRVSFARGLAVFGGQKTFPF